MNLIVVFFLEGFLLMILSGFMLIASIVSFIYGQNDFLPLLYSTLITFTSGLTLYLTLRKKVNVKNIDMREGFGVVSFGWMLAALFGCLPYLIHGQMFPDAGYISNFTDAFFESMSGFTTTGSTILPNIEIFPHGILLWRATTHWLGGMGIIVLAIAILPKLGISGYRLFKAEVPGPVPDKISSKVSDTAKRLWLVYMGITLLEVIMLMLGGVDWHGAVTHAFATMATGGFSPFNASVGGYDSAYVEWVITFFMFLAGANFALHFSFITGHFLAHLKDAEFKVYAGTIIVAVTLTMFWNSGIYEGFWDALRYNSFQVVSIMTTTGFGTFDFEVWPAASQMLLVLLMFIGGSAGSTGGGIKVVRLYLMMKFGKNELYKFVYPRRMRFVRYGKTVIEENTLRSITGFIMIYLFIFVVAVMIVSTMIDSGNTMENIITAFTGVAATLNNIGPGLGLVGPTENYYQLATPVKWIFSFLMMVGRLEVYSVIILLVPAGWRKGG
jgi:trk system potassium uptake protein